MDKSCESSGESIASTTANGSGGGVGAGGSARGQYLRQLNKISHKISKPTSSVRKPFDPSPSAPPSPPPPPPESAEEPLTQKPNLLPNPSPNQNQPPVYNISKTDFRDLVQKLTGSPAHERISNVPPPQSQPPIHVTPRPSSSRLQRIRPPPLAQIANRPPPLLAGVHPTVAGGFFGGGYGFPAGGFRPPAPLSPLPPLPTCHAAAESPISAYMRFLHTSISAVDSTEPKRSCAVPPSLISPKYTDPTAMNTQLQNQQVMPQNQPPPPSSPLPFGCFSSPKSPYALLSANVLFSPTGMGQLGLSQLPISPNVPAVPSPR